MYTFRILSRDANLSPAERTDLGLGAIGVDPRDTNMIVEVISTDSTGSAVIATFNYSYERAAVNKRQIASGIRAKAQTEIDLALFPDAGGETAMVGIEFPV